MPKHSLKLSLPSTEIANSDVTLDVFQDGKKYGTITMSRGGIDWYPKNVSTPISMNWASFDKVMKDSQ